MSSSASHTLQTGDAIGNGYVVEAFHAGGGMGQVYVARDTRLDRRVAIKLMLGNLIGSASADARFLREAQVLSRVVHPNIVAIHDFGRHGDNRFLIMEFIEGETLERLLARNGSLPLEEFVPIVRQVAAGLAEAHALGIVHRDIKPGNILLRRMATGGMLAKLVDFGLAREADVQTVTAVTHEMGVLGTPTYMAPEQIQGKAIDGRTDQYALAVMAYQMLTGRLPFVRDTLQGMLIAHVTEPPAPLFVGNSEASWPMTIERVLLKALSKRADDRFADISEFAQALEEAALPGRTLADSGRTVQCAGCGQATPDSGGFCAACGSVVPLSVCPACGVDRDGERCFCVECGTSLLADARRHRQAHAVDEPSAYREHTARTAVVLCAHWPAVAASAAQSVEFADLFLSVVEREGGRCVAHLGGDAVAVFGLGGMRDGEVEAAIDAGLRVQAASASLLEKTGDAGPRIGVEVGPLFSRGFGVLWGMALANGPAVEGAKAAAFAVTHGEVGAGVAAQREVRAVYDTAAASGNVRSISKRRDSARWLVDYVGRNAGVPLVARETELNLLLKVARKARRQNQLAVLPVIGPAGSGKTRLVGELLQRLEESGEAWHIDVGQCSALGVPVAYEPLMEILRSRLRAHEAADHDDLRARLAQLPGLTDATTPADVAARRLRILARMLGVEGGDKTQATRPATDAERQAALEAVTSIITAGCQKTPTVMVLEGLQWANPTTLELVAHLLRTCVELPLAVVLIIRSEKADVVLQHLHVPHAKTTPVELGPLETEEVAELVRAMRPGLVVPQSVAQAIAELSDGTPSRVQEVVEALTGDGVIVREGHIWQLDAARADTSLGGQSLGDALLHRLNRLPPAERELLAAVAVAGASAPRRMVSAMLGRDPSEKAFDAAKFAGFLVECRAQRFRGQREFAMKHSRMAEVARADLAQPRAAELHRRAAQWLLEWKDVRPPGFGAMLAHHFMVAGDVADATRHLLQSAQETLRALANRDAFATLAAVVEVARDWMAAAPEDPEPLVALTTALLLRAELGVRIGELEPACEAARQAMAVTADRPEAAVHHVRAHILLGDALRYAGSYAQGLVVLRTAAAMAVALVGGSGLAAQAQGVIAMSLVRQGKYEEAEAFAREVLIGQTAASPGDLQLPMRTSQAPSVTQLLARAEAHGSALDADTHGARGRLYACIGHAASRRHAINEALRNYNMAQAEFAAAGDDVATLMTALSMGNLAYRSGDLPRAAEIYRRTADSCEKLDYAQGQATALTNLGNVLLDHRKPLEAIVVLRDAEKMMRRTGAHDVLPETLRLLGQALIATGDARSARLAANEAMKIASEMGNTALVQASEQLLLQAQTIDDMLSAPTAAAALEEIAKLPIGVSSASGRKLPDLKS